MFPQQWAHTEGTIEQRLQAMLIARNEDGQPCWSEADWKMIYGCLKGVQGQYPANDHTHTHIGQCKLQAQPQKADSYQPSLTCHSRT